MQYVKGKEPNFDTIALLKGYCNTPVLTSFALNVYDVYIEFNHGVDLKEKSPPSIWLFYVSAIEIVANGISCYLGHINFGIM